LWDPVDLGRRRKDEPLHARGRRRLRNIQDASQVDVEHERGIPVEVAGALDRREMEDEVDARTRLVDAYAIPDIGIERRHAVGQGGIRAPAVVERAHLVAESRELLADTAADEASPARDESSHRSSPRTNAVARTARCPAIRNFPS